jgi:tail tube protein
MGLQNAVTVDVVYGAEGTFGTAAAAGGTSKTLRRVSSNLSMGKDIFESNEARSDQQVADVRHGSKRPGGGIEGELHIGAYDDFFEALLRGTWAAGASVLAATYTTLAFAVTSGSPGELGSVGTITAAAGTITNTIKVGDTVRPVGFDAANNGRRYKVVGMSGTGGRTMTVTPAPTAAAAAAGTSLDVAGNILVPGTVRRSFTMEQSNPEADLSELFKGMRLGAGNIGVRPNGMASVGFSFMGQDMELLDGADAPYFTAPAAQGTGKTVAGPSGALYLGGARQSIVTGFDISIDNGLSADPVIGSDVVPEVFYGPMRIGGSLSFFLQDKTLLNHFINEDEIALLLSLYANKSSTVDFISMTLPRIKLTGSQKSVNANGGVIVTSPFIALVGGVSGAVGGRTDTIMLQRSN